MPVLVGEFMSTDPTWLPADALVVEAALWMRERGANCVFVCEDDGRFLGALSAQDILYECVAVGRSPEATSLRQVLDPTAGWVTPVSTLQEAMRLAVRHSWQTLPVLDGPVLVGSVSLAEITDQFLRREIGGGDWID